ncbi:MAG TPA: hypothetical protein DEA22_13915 [Blastocatellia bacterium]|nr:hypothetical protein [Blastocatellia bacterium]
MTSQVLDKESRRLQRYSLALPARVEVKLDEAISWNEVTRLEDVSAFGAGFRLKRPIKRGRLVVVSVPMPRQLRCFDYLEPQYRIWALVRRCVQVQPSNGSPTYSIGLAFIGKNPPTSFMENPSKLYDISDRVDGGLWQLVEMSDKPDESDLPTELRRHTRFPIPESLIIELLDHDGNVKSSEISVTENISVGGAAVFTSFDVKAGTFLRVRSERHNITIISVVRGLHTGADGITRLHIEFIDNLFPLGGID